MLHHRKHPESVIKSYAYAAIAKAEGAELLYFSPKNVDFKNKTIKGYVFKNGAWKETISPFPHVIYNAGSPEKLAISSEIILKLREEIPFTTNSIGNKMRVYKRIKKVGKFSNYLIPSQNIYSIRGFVSFFNQYKKIVFKPVNGRKGQNVIFIERINHKYNVLIGTENTVYSGNELRDFISEKLRQEPYLMQPYIKCKTKSGNAYDFRLHVQKDGKGNWVIAQIYPRIGPSGSIVSNINSGGATNYLVPFLRQEFGDKYFDIKRYLEHFSIQFAKHMDEIQLSNFNETIDELGIDVALDDLGKIWIFEVNWRPGCPPAFYLELDVVKNMIRYAMFLAQNNQKALLEVKGKPQENVHGKGEGNV